MIESAGERPAAANRLARVSLRTWLLAAGATVLAATTLMQGLHRPAAAPPPAAPGPAKAAPAAPLPAFFETRLPPAGSPDKAETPPTPLEGGYRRDVVRPRPVVNVDRGDPADSAKPAADADGSLTQIGSDAASDPMVEAGDAGGLAGLRRTARTVLPEIFRMPPDNPSAIAQLAGPAASGLLKTAPRVAEKDPAGDLPPLGADAGPGFAPFGRLVKCTLVNTLDSLTARSEPIVALVSDELDWDGRTILPAGTEVFGYARPDPLIDARGVGRLTDTGEWTLVLPAGPDGADGRELILRGRAIDRSELALTANGRPRAWGPDDGADGLIGYTIATLDDEELRLFSAVAVSGLASGAADIAERRESVPGLSGALGATEPSETAGNLAAAAAGEGATAVANEFAARIRQEIGKHGVYVRVPAGKTFYLFVEQTIDLRTAAVGLRLPAAERGSEDHARPTPSSP